MDMKKLLFSKKTWESDENCERMRGVTHSMYHHTAINVLSLLQNMSNNKMNDVQLE